MVYILWAALAVGISIAMAGLHVESITRIMVVVFLLGQLVGRSRLVRVFPGLSPQLRFIILGTLLASVVEGFHMISKPVFPSVRVDRSMSLEQGLAFFGWDLLFTVPAYLVIFWVIWKWINRFRYSLWQYVLVMGFAQTMGDGGIFFFSAAPGLLFFLPYPMSNYHAMNILPFLAVQDQLNPGRITSRYSYLAIPAVVGTYLVCGGLIKMAGRFWGFETE